MAACKPGHPDDRRRCAELLAELRGMDTSYPRRQWYQMCLQVVHNTLTNMTRFRRGQA